MTKLSFRCPVKATADAIRGKWKVQIVWHLSFGTRRFAAIRGLLPGVSEKVLTEQLRQLEADGVLRRTVLSAMPPRVDYELTAAGRELMPILKAMCSWAQAHRGIEPNLPPPPAPDGEPARFAHQPANH